MNKMQNKRSFIRLAAYHLVKYKPLSTEKKETVPVLATLRDIGAGGVCLRTEEYLPVSSTIELKINFPFHATPISTLAKVVWIKKKHNSRFYEVGAQFMEIEETARKMIDDHLRFVSDNLGGEGIDSMLIFEKGGNIMNKLSKVLVALAFVSLVGALSIKFTTAGRILPGPLPVNWAKLADTFLLFSIAISLLNRK